MTDPDTVSSRATSCRHLATGIFRRVRGFLFVMLLAAFVVATNSLSACPLCLAPSQTWAEMVVEADVVLLAELISADEGSATSTPFSVVKVLRVHKGRKLLPNSNVLKIDEYVFAEKGDKILLKGSLQDADAASYSETFATNELGEATPKVRKVSATASQTLMWDFFEKSSEAAIDYVINSPSPDQRTAERLKYFLPFLENSDPLVATDAWGEFANAEYQDIKSVSNHFSTARLRAWIADAEAGPERRGLYGLMLGMCGTDTDREFLREQIGQPKEGEIRFGIEGLMGGLLTLSGENGLTFLEQAYLKNPTATSYDFFPVIQALQFVWTYEPDLLEKERLRQALHPLLNHADVREIVIRDLARWEDWNVVQQLPEIYTASKTDDPRTVQAIVSFLIVCLQADDQKSDTNVAAARQLLEVIRQENARLVQMLEEELAP